jgi:hypothetical protein
MGVRVLSQYEHFGESQSSLFIAIKSPHLEAQPPLAKSRRKLTILHVFPGE